MDLLIVTGYLAGVLGGSPWTGTAVVDDAAAIVGKMTFEEKFSMIYGKYFSDKDLVSSEEVHTYITGTPF